MNNKQKEVDRIAGDLNAKELELLDKTKVEGEMKDLLKNNTRDKEELTLQMTSIEEKCQKIEMDREHMKLKHKQQMAKESELEAKITSLIEEKDGLNASMKSAQETLNLEIKNLETQSKSQSDNYELQIEKFNVEI